MFNCFPIITQKAPESLRGLGECAYSEPENFFNPLRHFWILRGLCSERFEQASYRFPLGWGAIDGVFPASLREHEGASALIQFLTSRSFSIISEYTSFGYSSIMFARDIAVSIQTFDSSLRARLAISK